MPILFKIFMSHILCKKPEEFLFKVCINLSLGFHSAPKLPVLFCQQGIQHILSCFGLGGYSGFMYFDVFLQVINDSVM